MVGLCKAFFALLLQLAWAEWGPVQEWYGRLWRQHGPTGYWAETTEAGLLMHNEDHDWLEGWGYDPPPPVLVPNPYSQPMTPPRTRFNSPNRVGAPSGVACKRPRLPCIHERDDIGFGGGRASTDPPRPPTPPRPRRSGGGGGGGGGRGPAAPDRLLEALGQASEMLNQEQPEKRYEKKASGQPSGGN